jgi:TatD DNase family protein
LCSLLIWHKPLAYRFVEEAGQATDQKTVFEYLLAAAKKQHKYVIVHSKETAAEVLNLVEQQDMQHVIMHWFSGTREVFQKWVDRGAFFTVGAEIITSVKIQEMAREIPIAQLLTETDNPLVALDLPEALAMPRVLNDIVKEIARL